MVETTETRHRIPVSKKKKDSVIRTIKITEGVQALYDAKNKSILTYLFDKDKYTMKEAKKWVKDHKENSSMVDTLIDLDYIRYKRNQLNESYKAQVLDVCQNDTNIVVSFNNKTTDTIPLSPDIQQSLPTKPYIDIQIGNDIEI